MRPEESTSGLGGGKGKMNLIESMAPMPLSAIGKILIDVSFATEKITSIDEKAAGCHNFRHSCKFQVTPIREDVPSRARGTGTAAIY